VADDAIARRYATAMIEIAAEANAVEAIGNDLETFANLLQANDHLLGAALASPVFTVEERSAVLDVILPKLGLNPLTANLLRLANDKRRFALVPAMAEAYATLADERAGRARVVVQTAEPLSPQLEAEVRAALESATGKTVVLTAEVHPELIGGMVAHVGGTVYDSSIRTRLEQIKSALLQSQLPAQA
jgi:F-type H+-transporting ATPase subunit delta